MTSGWAPAFSSVHGKRQQKLCIAPQTITIERGQLNIKRDTCLFHLRVVPKRKSPFMHNLNFGKTILSIPAFVFHDFAQEKQQWDNSNLSRKWTTDVPRSWWKLLISPKKKQFV